MYPVIYCDSCGRNLSLERQIMDEIKKNTPLEDSEEYRLFGDTIDFPMQGVIKKLHLAYCCTMTITSKIDNTPDIYCRIPLQSSVTRR
jgi:hypothetical protein